MSLDSLRRCFRERFPQNHHQNLQRNSSNGKCLIRRKMNLNFFFLKNKKGVLRPRGQLEKPNLPRNELHTKFYCLERRP
jgi:hypothetical protein